LSVGIFPFVPPSLRRFVAAFAWLRPMSFHP
jgi:hypothetical protein